MVFPWFFLATVPFLSHGARERSCFLCRHSFRVSALAESLCDTLKTQAETSVFASFEASAAAARPFPFPPPSLAAGHARRAARALRGLRSLAPPALCPFSDAFKILSDALSLSTTPFTASTMSPMQIRSFEWALFQSSMRLSSAIFRIVSDANLMLGFMMANAAGDHL